MYLSDHSGDNAHCPAAVLVLARPKRHAVSYREFQRAEVCSDSPSGAASSARVQREIGNRGSLSKGSKGASNKPEQGVVRGIDDNRAYTKRDMKHQASALLLPEILRRECYSGLFISTINFAFS